jgi:methanogenic corrinoid protein MtbC1
MGFAVYDTGLPTAATGPVQAFCAALTALDQRAAQAVFERALVGHTPLQVIERLVLPALDWIGQGWDEGTLALSQVYMSGRLCEDLVARVLPPSDPDRRRQPRSAIVTLNDHHQLGKRIVHAQMRASGFELFDYGRMNVDELVARAQADRIRVLLISVLMLASALQVRAVRDAFDALGLPIRIAVGGAPFLFDPTLWREVGADAMGRSAADAARIVEAWMEGMA